MQHDDMGITRTEEGECPRCKHKVSAAAPLPGALEVRPEPGDWTICINCAEPLLLSTKLLPVLPPLGAYAALRHEDPEHYNQIEQGRRRIRNLPRRA
jgi:hypothetical protein